MNYNLRLIITAHLLIAAHSCSAMELTSTIKPKSIAFIDNKTIVVGGKGGCGIFDSKSQKLIHQLTPHDIIHLTTNDTMIVFVAEERLHFFDTQAKRKHQPQHIWHNVNLALGSTDNALFFYNQARLGAYDYVTGKRIFWSKEIPNTDTVPYLRSATNCPLIACHPTKNIILYPSSHQMLSMAQPGCDPLIKIHINTSLNLCGGGEYSADGSMVAFNNHHYKYFIYDVESNNASAYELAADNKEYISVAFHPNKSLLALLSRDNIVQYWDYVSRTLIATTHALAKNIGKKTNQYKQQTKRLTFSPDGTQLAVALKNNWGLIEEPQNNTNLALLYYLLHTNDLPQELCNIIMHNIINRCALSKINCAALSKVAPLLLTQTTDDQTGPSVNKETEHRNITIIYHNK